MSNNVSTTSTTPQDLNVTMNTKTKRTSGKYAGVTLGEAFNSEMSRFAVMIANGEIKMKERTGPLPSNVQLNTKKEFKPSEIAFLAWIFSIVRSFFVTRQVVCLFNEFRGQSSCPNYLNKNDHCRTSIDGLYRLPIEAFDKALVKEVTKELAEKAKEIRKQKAEEEKAKKAAEAAKAKEAKDAEAAKAKEAKASKKGSKKTSQKAEETPAEAPAETPVEASAETIVPPSDDATPEVNEATASDTTEAQ